MDNRKTLQQVTNGAGLMFIGTFLVYFIKFFYRLIVSRYLGPSDYGLLSLGEGVLNVALLFSLLGLHSGVIKFISHHQGNNSPKEIKGTILSVFKITVPLSIFISILIIIFSKVIAIKLFHEEKLIPILIIFAIAVPFYTSSNLLTSIFTAFNRIQYRNYMAVLGRTLLSIVAAIIIIFLKGNVLYIAFICPLSHIVPTIIR